MIIEKVQPEYIFNTSEEDVDQSIAEVISIKDVKESQFPIVFDSQMKTNDVVYTILHLVRQVSLKVYKSNMQV